MANKADVSPFTPGQPVPVELFVGREEEIRSLTTTAEEAANGRLKVAFLTGERGIGKSSLASFVRYLAERKHDLVTVHAFLGGVKSTQEMVETVFDRLIKAGQDASWFKRVRDLLGDHIQEVGLFGVQVGFSPSKSELKNLTRHFDEALLNILEKIGDKKRGLLIVLDDVNGLAKSEEFADWLKSFIDGIATSRRDFPVMLMLVGLEDMRRQLVESQPSLARVFKLEEIDPWSSDELSRFFSEAFSRVDTEVDDDAMDHMCRYAGGLPVLAHEIGDSAFRFDNDAHVTGHDAKMAVFNAAEIVGRKHLEARVLDSIRSRRYRSILQKLPAQNLQREFKREHALNYLDEDEERVFDNFLRKMRDLGVLERIKDRGQGWYRFSTELHFLYFLLESVRAALDEEEPSVGLGDMVAEGE